MKTKQDNLDKFVNLFCKMCMDCNKHKTNSSWSFTKSGKNDLKRIFAYFIAEGYLQNPVKEIESK